MAWLDRTWRGQPLNHGDCSRVVVLLGGLRTANLHEAQVHRRIAGDVRETSWASGVAAQIWRQRVQRCGDSAECEGSIEGQSYLKHELQELHDSAHWSQTFGSWWEIISNYFYDSAFLFHWLSSFSQNVPSWTKMLWTIHEPIWSKNSYTK